MSRSGARGPGGEPGSRLDALNSCHEKGFYWQEGVWGSFALTKRERDIGSTVLSKARHKEQGSKHEQKGRDLAASISLLSERCERTARSCDVH